MSFALTIAGSDPSGGAGVQSDLRTFDRFDVSGTSVVTVLTEQNSSGVIDAHVVSHEIVLGQLNALLTDSLPSATKIGVLSSAKHVEVVADRLSQVRATNIVLDPVLTSSSGYEFLDAAGQNALIDTLFPMCTLITPNIPEAHQLYNLRNPRCNCSLMPTIADWFLDTGCFAVLIKGGHSDGDCTDTLYTRSGNVEFVSNRIDTPHTHGTGCLLSASITALLSRGLDLESAVRRAKHTVQAALTSPRVMGKARGYPMPSPYITTALALSTHGEAAMTRAIHGLYVVTDTQLRPSRSLESIVSAAITGGATLIQIRDKTSSTQQLVESVRELMSECTAHGIQLIVNDRVDVALASGASGVHLGPNDMLPVDARRILGKEAVIGASVASVVEAAAAAPYVSYFGVGAIYGTTTKADAGVPIGLERIAEITRAFPDIPIVAIGGIKLENVDAVLAAGASAIAVVSAVVCADDMTQAVQEFVIKIRHSTMDKSLPDRAD